MRCWTTTRCGRSGSRTGCTLAWSTSKPSTIHECAGEYTNGMSKHRRKRQQQPTGPRQRVTLELTGVAHGGEAIGRHEGRVFFVPYGLPGETVTAEITLDKSDYARAEIVEIVQAAPERVTAPCAYFGMCGGCQ